MASAAVCAGYIDQSVRAGKMVAKGPFTAGQYTDDSQFARELLVSLVRCRGFDPANYASRLVTLFRKGRIVGGGSVVRAALERLAAGVPWQDAGSPAPPGEQRQ